MEAKELSLHIKANLKDSNDKIISKKNLMVQYFDLNRKQWNSLIDNLNVSSGKLDTIIQIGLLEDEKPEAYEVFFNAINTSTLPTIRLIDGETAHDEWTVVYSFFPVIYPTPENVLYIDFGDLWVLGKNNINRHIKGVHPSFEFAMGALPRPNGNHALFTPLHAALLNTEILSKYKADDHEIRLVTKGVLSDEEIKINELTKALNEQQNQLEIQLKINEEIQLELNALKQREVTSDDGYIEVGEDGIKTKAPIVEAKPARDVYTTIVDEVKNASEKLEKTPYTLSNISLNLKTHVLSDEEGFKLQLIDAETAAQSNNQAISEVKIDIETKNDTGQTNQNLSAPSIIGLTETVARQRLKSFGLRMKVIYQTSMSKTIGQAFKQTPMPGNDTKKGDTVIAIFAKQTEKFN